MKTTNPALAKKRLSGIVIVLPVLFALAASGSAWAADIACKNPKTGNTAQATINFDKSSYNNGDAMNVSAHYTEGEWALCVYAPDGKIIKSSTDDSLQTGAHTNDSLQVDKQMKIDKLDADKYGNGEWIAVIAFNNACNSSYREGNNFCKAVTATVTGGTNDKDTNAGSSDGDSNSNSDNSGDGSDGNSSKEQSTSGITISNPIKTDNFTTLVQNVLKWLLSVVGGIALLMLIYGGILYVTSVGDQKQADQGKRVITWTIVGLMLVLLSYSIMRAVNEIFTK